jgi:hypothetical protein
VKNLIALFVIVALFPACQLTEKDLERWSTQKKGERLLAAFVSEVERPEEMRSRAFDLLTQKRGYDQILTLFDQLKPEDVPFLMNEMMSFIERDLQEGVTTRQENLAADLSFFMMSHPDGAKIIKTKFKALKKLATWSMRHMRTGQKAESMVPPVELLLALAHVGGSEITDLIEKEVMEYEGDVAFIVLVHQLMLQLRDPKIDLMMAKLLLNTAKKSYPESISNSLVNAMVDNGNNTLLKYLIEIGRDRVVKQEIQENGLEKAGHMLGENGVDNFKRLLESTDAHANHIFYALRLMWKFAGSAKLGESLKAISPDFSTPVTGADLRLEVEDFCKNYVNEKKDDVRSMLTDLVDELKNEKRYWPARLYVITCIHLLYPDDYPKLMNEKNRFKKFYSRDKTRIPAWRAGSDVTLGQVAQEYLQPL